MVKMTLEISEFEEESFVQKIAAAIYRVGRLSVDVGLGIKIIKATRKPWGVEGRGPLEFRLVYLLPLSKAVETEKELRIEWRVGDQEKNGFFRIFEKDVYSFSLLELEDNTLEHIAEALIRAMVEALHNESLLIGQQSLLVTDLRDRLRDAGHRLSN